MHGHKNTSVTYNNFVFLGKINQKTRFKPANPPLQFKMLIAGHQPTISTAKKSTHNHTQSQNNKQNDYYYFDLWKTKVINQKIVIYNKPK